MFLLHAESKEFLCRLHKVESVEVIVFFFGESGPELDLFTTKSLSERAMGEVVMVRLAAMERRAGAAACLTRERPNMIIYMKKGRERRKEEVR